MLTYVERVVKTQKAEEAGIVIPASLGRRVFLWGHCTWLNKVDSVFFIHFWLYFADFKGFEKVLIIFVVPHTRFC